MLRWIFRKWGVGMWTGSSWLRIGTGSGHLWMWKWAFGFHKMRGNSWLVENRLASEEGQIACSRINAKICLEKWMSNSVWQNKCQILSNKINYKVCLTK
jgi:hypothetical protein